MPRTYAIARDQFLVFDRIGDRIALSDDDRRRVLLLSEREWSAWARVLRGDELPSEPPLSVMLRRLAAASHRLAVMAERGAA